MLDQIYCDSSIAAGSLGRATPIKIDQWNSGPQLGVVGLIDCIEVYRLDLVNRLIEVGFGCVKFPNSLRLVNCFEVNAAFDVALMVGDEFEDDVGLNVALELSHIPTLFLTSSSNLMNERRKPAGKGIFDRTFSSACNTEIDIRLQSLLHYSEIRRRNDRSIPRLVG